MNRRYRELDVWSASPHWVPDDLVGYEHPDPQGDRSDPDGVGTEVEAAEHPVSPGLGTRSSEAPP
jgi:hypothetical protein